jgi:micrococcal nuclease
MRSSGSILTPKCFLLATAHDGDDIRFGCVQIRLCGIASPEDYRGHRESEATRHLAGLVDGREVTCHLDGTTAGRSRLPVAICFLDGMDVGEMQVRAGHARDCPAFSSGRYAAAEDEARAAGHDLSRIYELPGYCRRLEGYARWPADTRRRPAASTRTRAGGSPRARSRGSGLVQATDVLLGVRSWTAELRGVRSAPSPPILHVWHHHAGRMRRTSIVVPCMQIDISAR